MEYFCVLTPAHQENAEEFRSRREEMTNKSDAVYRQLRQEIENLELAPGSKLGEVAVAERLGASRTPVREALRQLAADGLVDMERGTAARVAAISIGSVHALFAFRRVIEGYAASLVAARVREGDADAAAEFGAILVALRGSVGDPRTVTPAPPQAELDPVSFYALAERFDASIAHIADNPYLSRTITELRSQTTRLRNLSHVGQTRMHQSLVEHIAMCEAILAGEPDTAERSLHTHLDATREALLISLMRQRVAGSASVSLSA